MGRSPVQFSPNKDQIKEIGKLVVIKLWQKAPDDPIYLSSGAYQFFQQFPDVEETVLEEIWDELVKEYWRERVNENSCA